MRQLTLDRSGFTLVEVILAIAVLAIVLAAVAITMVSSMQHNFASGSRSQASQVMNYLGRRVAGGEISNLGDTEWDYGALATAFGDLTRENNLANPDLYRADIAQMPSIGIGDTSIPHYRVRVCWLDGAGETCVEGHTAGPGPGGESGEMLPGIN